MAVEQRCGPHQLVERAVQSRGLLGGAPGSYASCTPRERPVITITQGRREGLVTAITSPYSPHPAADRTLPTDRNTAFAAQATSAQKGTVRMCLAIPGQVIELVDEANRLAKVEVAGVRRNVNVGLLDDDGVGVQPGDWVLIHVGFALSKVDEEEAHATLALLQGMGAEYEQELEELKASVIE